MASRDRLSLEAPEMKAKLFLEIDFLAACSKSNRLMNVLSGGFSPFFASVPEGWLEGTGGNCVVGSRDPTCSSGKRVLLMRFGS